MGGEYEKCRGMIRILLHRHARGGEEEGRERERERERRGRERKIYKRVKEGRKWMYQCTRL